MTNSQFHGAEAKRARRRARILKRHTNPAPRMARSNPPAPVETSAAPSILRPPANPQGFNLDALPAPEKPAESIPAANLDARPEVRPAPVESNPEVHVSAPEFGCVYPGCNRTFKTRQALSGHQRAHKAGKVTAEGNTNPEGETAAK